MRIRLWKSLCARRSKNAREGPAQSRPFCIHAQNRQSPVIKTVESAHLCLSWLFAKCGIASASAHVLNYLQECSGKAPSTDDDAYSQWQTQANGRIDPCRAGVPQCDHAVPFRPNAEFHPPAPCQCRKHSETHPVWPRTDAPRTPDNDLPPVCSRQVQSRDYRQLLGSARRHIARSCRFRGFTWRGLGHGA